VTRAPGKPAKKYSQAARLHDVIRILEARHGATVDEISEECGVTRRTVYRDLDAIRDAGYPLVSETQSDGHTLYRFMTGYRKTMPITFSLDELMTLYLCRGQMRFLHGTPFDDDLEAIFSRIRSILPSRSVAHLERITEAAAPRFQGLRDYSTKREILESLRKALLYQYSCTLSYAPPNRKPQSYTFDPYTLLLYQNSLYLGGYAHNRKALRLFLVDRILDVDVSKDRFDVPEGYRIEDLTGMAFGLIDENPMLICLRFGREVAHLVSEKLWHPDQTLVIESDGSLLLSFNASGEKEILSWIYSYLPHVEVISPHSLKMLFMDGLKKALNK